MLYATCFQLQRPLEPFLVDKLVKSDGVSVDSQQQFANVQSFFSAVQMIGSLASGVLIDWLGVRGGFLLTFGASALSYQLLAQTTSIYGLYLSKIPAVFQVPLIFVFFLSRSSTPVAQQRSQLGGCLADEVSAWRSVFHSRACLKSILAAAHI